MKTTLIICLCAVVASSAFARGVRPQRDEISGGSDQGQISNVGGQGGNGGNGGHASLTIGGASASANGDPTVPQGDPTKHRPRNPRAISNVGGNGGHGGNGGTASLVIGGGSQGSRPTQPSFPEESEPAIELALPNRRRPGK